MSLDDDFLADLVDPLDPTDAQDDQGEPRAAGLTELAAVPPHVFEELVARHGALLAAAAATLDQLLEARDQLADAEGALAIAEAQQAMLGEPSETTRLHPETVTARENVARRQRAVTRAARTVERLERDLGAADTAAAEAGDRAASVTPVEPAPEPPPRNLYDSVYQFVPAFLAKVYARPIGAQINSFRWCARWWEHAEAVSRLEALWKSFEVLRLDPGTGAAVWWRDFADPTMSTLCSAEGPFKQCSDTQHKLIDDLPTEPAPRAFLEASPSGDGSAA